MVPFKAMAMFTLKSKVTKPPPLIETCLLLVMGLNVYLLKEVMFSPSVLIPEGSACAVVFDCKFIETSASLHHNVQDLFEGIVRQIRLRKDSKEENARRMASCRRRESISKKAKRFLGRFVARKNKKMAFRQKSKSCHDLTVL